MKIYEYIYIYICILQVCFMKIYEDAQVTAFELKLLFGVMVEARRESAKHLVPK